MFLVKNKLHKSPIVHSTPANTWKPYGPIICDKTRNPLHVGIVSVKNKSNESIFMISPPYKQYHQNLNPN